VRALAKENFYHGPAKAGLANDHLCKNNTKIVIDEFAGSNLQLVNATHRIGKQAQLATNHLANKPKAPLKNV
jgi:hypothetical protein